MSEPEAQTRQLRRRQDAALPFDPAAVGPRPVLLDSCAYIDAGKGRLPAAVAALLTAPGRVLLHCVVCRAELQAGAAKLSPDDPRTADARVRIAAMLARMPEERIVAPSRAAWDIAGRLAGTLARTQGMAKGAHVRLLQDAAILLAAEERGAVTITANIADFDLLTQLRPGARVLFYREGG
jgi:predicted nucleic acid-binding protein